jgi:calnexin
VTGKWELRQTADPQAIPGEKMIFGSGVPAHFGISTQFATPLDVTNKTLVLQYETRYSGDVDCAGAYIKLFGQDNFNPAELCNETRYIIMFGPDRCGSTNKVHFIFRHQNPLTGIFEEKHMNDAPQTKNDTIAHLWTLIVRPDNTFEILIDAKSAKNGSLLHDFTPPVESPREIDDPSDQKPSDWVDNAQIDDPDAQKPADWDESEPQYIPDPDRKDPPEGWLVDEPKFIPDPDATIPDSWDPDIHGDWEPPTIPNPKCDEAAGCGEYEAPLIENVNYHGKWTPPQIPNPAYKGPWNPRKIPNPHFYSDPHPHNFPSLIGAGFELWMVSQTIGFGNVYIGTDEAAVRAWNEAHFLPKFKIEEEEWRKNSPTPTPLASVAPVVRSGWGYDGDRREFVGAFTGFVDNVVAAARLLFERSPAAAVIVSLVLVAVPVLLCACCGRSPPPPPPRRWPLTQEERERRRAERASRKAAADGGDAQN